MRVSADNGSTDRMIAITLMMIINRVWCWKECQLEKREGRRVNQQVLTECGRKKKKSNLLEMDEVKV